MARAHEYKSDRTYDAEWIIPSCACGWHGKHWRYGSYAVISWQGHVLDDLQDQMMALALEAFSVERMADEMPEAEVPNGVPAVEGEVPTLRAEESSENCPTCGASRRVWKNTLSKLAHAQHDAETMRATAVRLDAALRRIIELSEGGLCGEEAEIIDNIQQEAKKGLDKS